MIRPAALALPALALLCLALPAGAADLPVRAEDRARLEALPAQLGLGLSDALSGGTEHDVETLARAMAGEALPADHVDLEGEWDCRMMKLGKLLPLVVYSSFRCAFTPTDDGLRFEKLTGSQRTTGLVAPEGSRMIYLGTGFTAGDTPPDYTALPDTTDPQASPQILPEVGVVQQVARNRARILFPAPFLESELNVLELTR